MTPDEEFEQWVVFFRLYGLGEIDCEMKDEARKRLAERYPAEWAAAQQLGPMGRAEERAWARWRRPAPDTNVAAAG